MKNPQTITTIKDGKIVPITVDWDKMPCKTCERLGTLVCPKGDCWNKDGKYFIS